jgi:hypothetical protein
VTEGVGATTEGVDTVTEADEADEEVTVDVKTGGVETCDVAVAFTEIDTALVGVVFMEAVTVKAVPKQATPPSL